MKNHCATRRDLLIAMVGAASSPGAPIAREENSISLAGTWKFQLDPENVGIQRRWFSGELSDSVTLPGTTDTNKKGIFQDERAVDRLSRVWYWKGPAWYQREIAIPRSWQGKRITLYLERTKTTRVWLDGMDCGAEDTLSAPQVFDLGKGATSGRHTVTVLVDNAKLPPVGPSHAVDERTQSNWNGIVGAIELRATDPVWLDDVQVYPDIDARTALIRAVLRNGTGNAVSGRIDFAGRSWNVQAPTTFPLQSTAARITGDRVEIALTYKLGKNVPLWDEFNPALIRLSVSLVAKGEGKSFRDRRIVTFGMRKFSREGNRLMINGRPVFLRGKLDCANFPLTGYAPMDKAEWIRLFRIAKSYGLNHYRFHSWFPPAAALEAADEVGLYLAPELPNKSSRFEALDAQEPGARYNVDYIEVDSTSAPTPLGKYLLREGALIFKAYGNHPSFTMFTLGNELGRAPAMYQMVAYFKEIDSRHLYAQGSNNMHWEPSFAEGDDFWVTKKTGKDLPLRGAFFSADYPHGHIDHRPPSTMVDYSDSIRNVPAPVISHEVGEYEVTPDYREISRYTGVLKPRNLEIFRERLKNANMLDMAHDFMRASGALALICYREEIEAALRTPGLAGFQLLDLQDFPGQGTALVGMLNVFMESKGLVKPEDWRQFCSETVPLALMEKYTWTTGETFNAEIKIAHHGAVDIPNAHVTWNITNADGTPVAGGVLSRVTTKQGQLSSAGRIDASLDRVKAPAKLRLTLAMEGTPFRNTYDLWVYPPEVDTSTPANVMVADRLDAAVRKRLSDGGSVLLFPRDRQPGQYVKGAFQTSFWSWPMFAKAAIARKVEPPPGTQGFICDPAHPALAHFPTEFHSNWQWWQIVKNSRPVVLDDTPAPYRPIIHVIDNFARNHKLGLLFEAKAENGKLLVCASDLPHLQRHPEARQLMHSLLRYAGSDRFQPSQSLDWQALKDKF